MEDSNSDKVKPPPEDSDEPPLLNKGRKPFFLSKRKSKSFESQIQGTLLRLLISMGYNIVLKKPKMAKKSLPFLTVVSLQRGSTFINFKMDLECKCKLLESEKENDGRYTHNQLMKYTQRNRIALTCNQLTELLIRDGFQIKTKRSKESVETVQLIKFTQLWNDQLDIMLDSVAIQNIGEDMISFVSETFQQTAREQIMFGKEFYYGYEFLDDSRKTCSHN
ncbi:hypothetical protein EDI_125510 [Entamoeba dispar SAW760]|uniref:Uncharacterized protein n=1 Tax=Entamoeba dispar (strain ATCC PRA-260 / SAW760) TaxID=370354 RepID=B0EC56_ENTDS|nr:uncharacterized protein EDI_125510 [Entamoeba dispar SAW760]EDR27904.1 hypothetical protein EDI_125510 [Entamoeba dispar SAW760]|eukprot:EDR27904.1 hypothetical protein EDI_125510 [Entamoeba dispar SAW760]